MLDAPGMGWSPCESAGVGRSGVAEVPQVDVRSPEHAGMFNGRSQWVGAGDAWGVEVCQL